MDKRVPTDLDRIEPQHDAAPKYAYIMLFSRAPLYSSKSGNYRLNGISRSAT